ncbi:MAG: hypothetical protein ACI3T9_03820 [Romboutsia timonensis]
MKSISVDFLKNWLIAILLFVVIVLSDTIGQKNKELKEKQTSIEQLNVQVNSLWENVLQLQEEYGKIIDKLYNPNLGVDNNAKN